jgi:hypothetical protein
MILDYNLASPFSSAIHLLNYTAAWVSISSFHPSRVYLSMQLTSSIAHVVLDTLSEVLVPFLPMALSQASFRNVFELLRSVDVTSNPP